MVKKSGRFVRKKGIEVVVEEYYFYMDLFLSGFEELWGLKKRQVNVSGD